MTASPTTRWIIGQINRAHDPKDWRCTQCWSQATFRFSIQRFEGPERRHFCTACAARFAASRRVTLHPEVLAAPGQA